ncbi:DUF389 domain-containing protein [Sphingobium baderi]|uniref:DUF389 domain-containing protein n=1 Tax=Sphingobium baderi TaxID=1332080 RepID=UPI002B402564|nr:DUF389 domain-containing protein [Sphingobium baderi]WRD78873.1 DUF389 domain-containing protein [Sphingobium baderi]
MADRDLGGTISSSVHARLDRMALYRWWRLRLVGSVDHERVIATIEEESGWSPRYLFMPIMSAGIAVLGLLLSSPAVVIGAMLISPLMNPILGLGFSLALFDFREMRRALVALAAGSLCAVAFTALIVALSPLQAPTSEIIARTRPNLFDLGVALFAALAGTFAIIRGRGGTIVGVAIATALMPPLAVVGYGLATWNLPVLAGALALFVTNFVTIALSATVMARFYGFGHFLSSQQSWAQTVVLIMVFIVMAVPLAFSLKRIATEALTVTQVRSFLADRFGNSARVTQLDIDFDVRPIAVRSVIIAPRARAQRTVALQSELARQLGEPLRLQLDQVLLEPGAGALEAQREELRQASTPAAAETARIAALAQMISLAAGVPAEAVTIDRDHRRASAMAAPLPGATVATYRTLEQRARRQAGDWDIAIIPPQADLPRISFDDGADTLDPAARDAALTSAWAARRWNIPALAVPGLPESVPKTPNLGERRGLAVAAVLREQGIAAVPGRPASQSFRLITPVEGGTR